MVKSSLVVWVAALSSVTIAACGEPYELRKPKSEAERAVQAVSSTDPSAEQGWDLVPNRLFETAHPYKNRERQVYTVTHPGASEIRVKLESFDLETGYDYVTVSTPEGASSIRYTGKLGSFWTASIPGPSARIELVTDYSVTKFGFAIGGYAAKSDGQVWESKSFVWETKHPYRNGEYQVVEISEPRAVKMKLLFGELITEEGYDFVGVYNESGLLVAQYSGNLGKFETPAIEGRKLYVLFMSDESVVKSGVSIAQYSFVPEETEAGCMCMALFQPVCGENAKTYGNSCEASCEQVAIAHEGACGTQGDFCGGIAAIGCAEGWSCAMNGTYPDAGGSCTQE